MNILTAQQIKEWDQYTIQHEPVQPIDLMERAARQCKNWLDKNHQSKKYTVFCGKGNNGGDGLAISRMMVENGLHPAVYILGSHTPGSAEFECNLQRIMQLGIDVRHLHDESSFPIIDKDSIVIDALFGIGLRDTLQGLGVALINHINLSGATVVSIDLPSGMIADASSKENAVIRATDTLTFQCYKTALLLAQNAMYFGKVHVLDIGLHQGYIHTIQPQNNLLNASTIKNIFRPRNEFAHKGTYGHAMIIGGSYGKMGAVALATSACIRSGAGLVTAYVPQCGYSIIQTSVPEAMTITDNEERMIVQPPSELPHCDALGIGPGMGTDTATCKVVSFIIRRFKKPVVLDADALNCIGLQPELLSQLCKNSILTPHPKEFDRIFGDSVDDFQRMEKAKEAAVSLKLIILVKGHHTQISFPDGSTWFNTTGNAGLAKGGSGDVLTGILTALLAQGYTQQHAALLGVYLHGMAGDIAAAACSKEAMTASDIIISLQKGFLSLNQ